eukprot:s1698_g8.t1
MKSGSAHCDLNLADEVKHEEYEEEEEDAGGGPAPDMQNRIKRTMALTLQVIRQGTHLLMCSRCRRKPRLMANPFD